MHCCQYYAVAGGGDPSFTIELPQVTFGAGCLAEAGAHAQALGLKRVGLFTDKRLARLEHVATVEKSLRAAGIDVARRYGKVLFFRLGDRFSQVVHRGGL